MEEAAETEGKLVGSGSGFCNGLSGTEFNRESVPEVIKDRGFGGSERGVELGRDRCGTVDAGFGSDGAGDAAGREREKGLFSWADDREEGRGFLAGGWGSSASLSRENEELERRMGERGRFWAGATGEFSSASESDSGSAHAGGSRKSSTEMERWRDGAAREAC